MTAARRRASAFTLIELLVVIIIIAILMGLAFPVFQGVMNQAKKTQAKNDVTQIVTAVNAFYTEYGKYPLVTADKIYGPAGVSNDALFDVLRGKNLTENPRQIIFISPPDAKSPTSPRSGIGTATGVGQFFDPWGTAYNIAIDGNYDNQVANPYGTNGAGADPLRQGAISWSYGKDVLSGKAGDGKFTSSDDIISWQ